jgi:ppGpp synthetase/RelA/SpoT-type nucleotidyltranferase
VTLDEYERAGRLLYRRLAETVAAILGAAIQTHGGLRLQQIQSRAKDPESLRKKLAKLGLSDTDSLATAVKDLAGCRLVFYTNTDVDLCLGSGILRDNFDVDWDRSKIHHPVPNQDGENGLFSSNNYVVKLRDDRITLAEYAGLKDLWCEVQVQTTLNHAWAEMAHDTVYKRPDVSGFGQRSLDAIETRMNNIMRKYLMPAGYEFQKVVYDAERLAAGLKLFDRGALEELGKCADNNARFDVLQRFADYVLPNYDDPAGVYPEIREALIAAVKAARTARQVPIETPFGDIRGRTADQIERLAANVFERLRYADVEQTFNAACELYLGAGDAEGRKLWTGLAVNLAKNELEAWKQVGPGVQHEIVLRIEEFSLEEREALRGLLLPVLREVLNPDVTGTSNSWNTVTLRQGAVAPSEFLQQTRTKALEQLRGLYEAADNLGVLQEIVGDFMQATRTPYNANYANDLMKIILQNSLWVVGYFESVVDDAPFELRQRMEHDLYFLYARGCQLPETLAQAVGVESDALGAAILRFRDKVNADPQFVIYKTLVGYQSIFPEAWDRKDFDFQADEDYRNAEIERFVETVGPDNATEWLATLQRCAQRESNDLATFPSFGRFLQKLAARKPAIVRGYLADLDGRLSGFLPAMLIGLSEGPAADEGVTLIRSWLRERRHVAAVMRYLRFTKPAVPDLLDAAMSAAIETEDDAALRDAVHVASAHHSDVEGGLIDSILMPAIEQLTAHGKTWWVDEMWFLTRESPLFADLTADHAERILAAMVRRPKIEFHAQAILAALGARWPEKIIELFERRLGQPEDDERGYEAVPFQFHEAKPLVDSAALLVERAHAWYQADKALFSYRGGRLIAAMFPTFSDALAAALVAFVNGDQADRVDYVLRILRAYHGQAFLQPVCREVVMQLPEDDPLLGEVEIILDSTGVVSGEFGFVRAYQAKKREIEPWLDDASPAVQAFTRKYLRTLDRQIAAEQRRSEEAQELRKRSWGDAEDGSDPA